MSRFRVLAAGLIAWAIVPAIAAAQIGTGAFSVTVVDRSGSPVASATVTVTAQSTNMTRRALSGSDGSAIFAALAPGTYSVRVESSGFRPLMRHGLRLATGETVALTVQLDVGALAEAVSVVADAPLLRSGTSGLGHVVDNGKIVGLPLNGRSFITLAALVPGVAMRDGSTPARSKRRRRLRSDRALAIPSADRDIATSTSR